VVQVAPAITGYHFLFYIPHAPYFYCKVFIYFLYIFFFSGYARYGPAPRVRALNQVPVGGLHKGVLQLVYKDGKMVNWHD
jgi:hypothetical protein